MRRIAPSILLGLAATAWSQTPIKTGPDIGSRVPGFEAPDQNGARHSLESLQGPKGLMLVFFRSADWCPYCKVQLVELQQNLPEIQKRGLKVAAISYDSVAILKSFAERVGITFPLLSDPDSKIIQTYGILNETSPKGMFYGIPYPGTYILDTKSVVIQKYFEDDYTQRYTASDILAREFGAPVAAAHSTVAAKHLQLSASAGVEIAHVGQRIVLALDIDLPKGMHVYAPGVQGYIPIEFTIAELADYAVHPAVYPPSKSLRLEVIKETVPVYTDHIRVLSEITMAKTVKPGDLTVAGTLRYQACDDRECFTPETVPLKWTLRVEPLDRQRAPAEIQHK